MYRPEFAAYVPAPTAHPALEGQRLQCIGWLDSAHPYRTGPTPALFRERLLHHCTHGIFRITLGLVECSLCATGGQPLIWPYDGQALPWVKGEIFVMGGEAIYVAPSWAIHYVETHEYHPPEAFIEAVIHGPLPTTAEHREAMLRMGMQAISLAAR